MVPIYALRNGQLADLRTGNLYNDIQMVCADHKANNRALAFAFLLFNTRNPQIVKLLDDDAYWQALDEISGSYLSIFYMPQRDNYFGQDVMESDGIERRGLHGIEQNTMLIPMLKGYLGLDTKIEYPAILFFQEHEGLLSDSLIVGLNERNVEASFWELNDLIKAAVDRLEEVKEENASNSHAIFELLKAGVQRQKFKYQVMKTMNKVPIQLLAGWLISKA